MMTYARVLLLILDGWGHGPDDQRSAIAQAKTPVMQSLYKDYPNAELTTFGQQVGLPEGQMGNSEVGHLNIGAGRIVYQELARINRAIQDKSLAENKVLKDLLQRTKTSGKALHIMGLLSDGGVHSHIKHLEALVDIATAAGLEKIYIHAFMDGRDVGPTTGIGFLRQIQEHIAGGPAQLASITGRYYAMDRDKRWERTRLAYDALVHGKGELSEDPITVMQQRYEDGQTDEFIKPIIIGGEGQPIATIENGDAVLFFNFRTDRPRQITAALTQQDFPDQDMKKLDLDFVTMTRYDENHQGIQVLFLKENLRNTLGETLSRLGKSQLRMAETEKYPHVTFFFSGGREEPFPGEDRIMVASPKVATYDLQPEMSAEELTDKLVDRLEKDPPDFVVLNFANTDMVGHTGVFDAAVKAAETVDSCLARILPIAEKQNYATIIIADHGNSDIMVNEDGSPHTAHTMSPVPILLVAHDLEGVKLQDGKLADIAPTILEILGEAAAPDMDGVSLIVEEKAVEKYV